MDLYDALILGTIQGLTEFLPVSSSGHLVLGEYLLGIPAQDLVFEVFVHFGTLLAVFTVFYKDILNMILAFLGIFTPRFWKQGLSHQFQKNMDFRLMLFILIGTIPAGIAGVLFEEKIESVFASPQFTCAMLIVTALILFATLFAKHRNVQLGYQNTFIMGVAQALAILPGISRSGSTISMGLYMGIDGNTAARFSFLLSIPAILGATVLKVTDLVQTGITGEYFISLAGGTIAAYIFGYLAIISLLGIVRRGKLYWFAPYCFILGILGLLYL